MKNYRQAILLKKILCITVFLSVFSSLVVLGWEGNSAFWAGNNEIASINNTGDWPPPAAGDWIISMDTYVTDVSLVLATSIIVENGGSLTLDAVNITFELLQTCSQISTLGLTPPFCIPGTNLPWDFGITVKQGGRLLIYDSIFEKSNPGSTFYIEAQKGSDFVLSGSTVNRGGYYITSTDAKPAVLSNTSNSLIINNKILKSDNNAIELKYSNNSIVSGNYIDNEGFRGIETEYSSEIMVTGNFVNNTSDYGIHIYLCKNCTFSGNTIVNNNLNSGIYLSDSANSSIVGNLIDDTGTYGVYIHGSGDSIVSTNIINNTSFYALYGYGSPRLNVSHNIVLNAVERGIWLLQSWNNSVTRNYIINSGSIGVFLENNANGTIVGNFVADMLGTGIYLLSSGSTNVYLNALINCSTNSAGTVSSSGVSWDNGTHGNYWSDYTGEDVISPIGIGDDPYNITYPTDVDNYPIWSTDFLITLLPQDLEGPDFVSIVQKFPTPQHYQIQSVFGVVVDPSGVEEVILSYSDQSSPWTNITMNQAVAFGGYSAKFPPLPPDNKVQYKLFAKDSLGNWAVSQTYNYVIPADTDGPSIGTPVSVPEAPNDLDAPYIYVKAGDPSGVDSVILGFTKDGESYNATMNYNVTSGDYSYQIPSQPVDTKVQYQVYANDSVGNWASSQVYSYIVIKDIRGPVFGTPGLNPGTPTEKDSPTVTVSVSDQSGMGEVLLSYTQGGIWKNITMTGNKLTGIYSAQIPSQPVDTLVEYKFYAYDTLKNWATSSNYSYIVTFFDNTGPDFSSLVINPETPTELDSPIVSVEAKDPSGVDSVLLSYSKGSSWQNITMDYDSLIGIYFAKIPVSPVGTRVDYMIYANDSLGNWERSQVYSYVVSSSTTTGIEPTGPTTTTKTFVAATNTTTVQTTTTTQGTGLPSPGFDILVLTLGILTMIPLIRSRKRKS